MDYYSTLEKIDYNIYNLISDNLSFNLKHKYATTNHEETSDL